MGRAAHTLILASFPGLPLSPSHTLTMTPPTWKVNREEELITRLTSRGRKEVELIERGHPCCSLTLPTQLTDSLVGGQDQQAETTQSYQLQEVCCNVACNTACDCSGEIEETAGC